MSDDPNEGRPTRTLKPGDRVLRVRTRRAKLPLIERRLETPLWEGLRMFRDIATQTPILWFLAGLVVLVILGPIPVWLFERTAADADMDSYWVALWWAVSAVSTVGHSGVGVETAGGRIFGSIFTVLSVSLFFGSVIAAFSSYFLLTWRTPKRQLVDTINYYLQRVEELSVEELEDLEDMTRGLLLTARERVEARTEAGEAPPEKS